MKITKVHFELVSYITIYLYVCIQINHHGKLLFIFILFAWGNRFSKKICIENGNTEELDEFYRMIGFSQENIWIQKSPPGS